MAGNFRASAGVETPSQGRTAVQGSYVPVRQAPVQQVPAGYQLAYQVGGPRYMYGETPLYGAYYRDGGIVPGQIYGNMRGSREGADMFGFWPTMFQSQPYATASQMYTPGLGVMPLIGYPSKYPHVVMGGYSDYGAGIANQAMGMMLPLLMMGLYRQMFPMMPQAPAAAKGVGGGGGGKSGGGSGGGSSKDSSSTPSQETNTSQYAYKYHYPGMESDYAGYMTPSAYNNPAFKAQRDIVGPFAPDNFEGNGKYYYPQGGYVERTSAPALPNQTAIDVPPLAPPRKSDVSFLQRSLGLGAASVPPAGQAADTPVAVKPRPWIAERFGQLWDALTQ